MAPADWVLQPELLFRFLEEHGTYCWLPNFAFSYLARRRAALTRSYSLGHVRGWVSCSEPIRMASLDEFTHVYADWGVRHQSLQTSYAMAENVFAVSHSSIGEAPRRVERSGAGTQTTADGQRMFDLADTMYVSSGRPLADMRVRIVAADGTLCADRERGEIQLQTPSLFQGYVSRAGITRDAFTPDGWYASGDHGFLADGELFITGRIKDLIIVGGQNVIPDDIEACVNAVAGVHPGRAVAFGVDDGDLGTEAIGVVAELTGEYDAERAAQVEMDIRLAVVSCVGIAPRFTAVVPQRWIVKSTAGKISRKDTREKFIRERLGGTGEGRP
jgi:fatty-acyl-CoA synthase